MRKNERAALIAFIALLSVLVFLGIRLVGTFCNQDHFVSNDKSESVSYAEIEDAGSLVDERRPDFGEPELKAPEPKKSELKDPTLEERIPDPQRPDPAEFELREPEKKDNFAETVDRNPSMPEGMTREEQIMWHLDRAMELLAEEYGFDYDAPSRQQANGPFEAPE